MAPKITGMIIDLEIFEVDEIVELLGNEEELMNRVKEAEDLIISSS